MTDATTLKRPQPGAVAPAPRGDVIVSPPAATLSGKILRSGRIKLRSSSPEAKRKRRYRAAIKSDDDGYSVVRLPTKTVVDAVDHLEKMNPGIRGWPVGDPRFDRAFAGYVANLIERDRERSGK
jgi:hypothetical protein